MYQAKEVGKTDAGNVYIILQDGPSSFHVSVQVEGLTIYDHIENPSSVEDLKEQIAKLESEILDSVKKLPTTT